MKNKKSKITVIPTTLQSKVDLMPEHVSALDQLANSLSSTDGGAPVLFSSQSDFISYLSNARGLEKAIDCAMQARIKTVSKKRALLFCALFLAVAMLFVAGACSSTDNNPDNSLSGTEEQTMANVDSDVFDSNARIVAEHLEQIEFSEERRSHEGLGRLAAGFFGQACNKQIAEITSEQNSNGEVTLTITDETGEVFVIGLGKYGSITAVTNLDGDILVIAVQ